MTSSDLTTSPPRTPGAPDAPGAPKAPAPPPATARACPNCGEVASERARFCIGCGQKTGENLLTVRAFLADILDEVITLDGRLPRSLGLLLFRPGHLTREYAAGRIARYVRPFRLYLASSVIFFLLLSFTIKFDGQVQAAADFLKSPSDRGQAAAREVLADALTRAAAEQPTDEAAIMAQVDSAMAQMARAESQWIEAKAQIAQESGNALERFFVSFVESAQADPTTTINRFVDRVLQDAPKAIFILLPVFALCLKGLYIRRRRLYVEHLIFVLHVHAFAFLLATVLILVPDSWPTWFIWLLFPAYLFWAMLKVYGQSIPKTLVKFFIFGSMYFVSAVITIITTIVFAAVTL